MPAIDSLQTLLVEQLKDLYDAEKRLTKAIPKLVKAASNEELASALETHLSETETQMTRLEKAFKALGETAKGKPCAGMKGIIEEGDEHVGEEYEDDGLRDAVIIGAAQRVEHYEIAAYGTAIAHARLLGQETVVDLLEQSLAEEKSADQKLTDIAESVVNLDAAAEDDEEEERPTRMGTRVSGGKGLSGRSIRAAAADRGKGTRGRR